MKRLLSLILAITMIAAFLPTAFATDGETTTVSYTYAFNNNSWLERGNPSAQAPTLQRTLKNDTFATETLTDTEWAYLGSGTSTSVAYYTSSAVYNMVVGNYDAGKTSTRAVTSGGGEWLAFKIEIPENGKYSPDIKAVINQSCIDDLDVYILPADTTVTVGNYNGKLVDAFADSGVYGKYVETTVATTCTRENAKKFSEFSFTSINAEDYKAIDGASTYIEKGNSTTPESLTTGTKKDLELDAGVYVVLLCANDAGWLTISSLTLTKQDEESEEPVVPDEPDEPVVPEVSYNATVPVTYTLAYDGWFEQINKSTKAWQRNKTTFSDSTNPNDAWAYIGTSTGVGYTTNAWILALGNFRSADGGALRAKIDAENGWIALQIKVPETGIYKVTEVESFLNVNSTTDMDMYILPTDAQVTVNGFSGTLLSSLTDEKVYGTFATTTDSWSRSGAQTFDKFTFDELDKNNYKVVDSANLYKKIGSNDALCEKVPFTAGKEVVLTADTPYVMLFCTNEADKEVNIHSVTLAPVTEVSGDIAFAAGADIQYKVGDGAYTDLSANNTAQIPVGSSVTVKVTDEENFAGWVRGTEESGVWVSGDAEYPFNIMSPTYLTPIYTTPEEDATHSVEFWDENGAYVDTITAPDGEAVFPDEDKYGLVGGSFNGWWIDATTQLIEGADVEEGITRAVAQYSYETFGKKVENSNTSATYWKRGDDVVAYGTSYDFYQWNGTATITFGTEEIVKNPLVVLDSTPVDDAYMIEYDKGNASEIVEAGILFGSTAEIHIGSTDGSKAASQRNGVDDNVDDGHGQFCAKPNTNGKSDYVRGYLIYRGTDSKLYVIYTAAVATSAQ